MSCIFEIFKIFTGMGLALHFATCGASGGTPKSALEGLCRDGSIVGAVGLVALDGRVVSLETAGYADSESKTPMSADTIFWIASQTKPITAAAVMILVDEGRLSLDTPIARIVPELKNMRLRDGTVVPDSEITVRALLSHTAGFPEMPTDSPDFKADATTLAEQMRVFSALPLEFRAGEKYLYSNVGINIAGRIVEVVSGEPYEKFVEARILKPLGMSDTSFVPRSAANMTEFGYCRNARCRKCAAGRPARAWSNPTACAFLRLPIFTGTAGCSAQKWQTVPTGG